MNKGEKAGSNPIGIVVEEGKSYFGVLVVKVQNNHFVMALIRELNLLL